MRLDTALYFHTLDRAGVAALVKDQAPFINASATATNPAPAVAADATNNLNAELHARFLRTIYPSKLFLGYAQPGVDVTVGDFYVQLGRGLVFSVRKIGQAGDRHHRARRQGQRKLQGGRHPVRRHDVRRRR